MQSVARNGLPMPSKTSVLQLLVSIVGLFLSVAAAGLFGLVGLAGVFGESLPLQDSVAVFSLAWIALLLATLTAPSILYSILPWLKQGWLANGRLQSRLSGNLGISPAIYAQLDLPADILGYRMVWALALIWPLVLALGSVVAKTEQVAWLLLPPINLLAIGIPIWWLIEMARHRLPSGGPKQGWGALNFTIFLSTPAIMVVEIIGLVFVLALVFLAILNNPAWFMDIQQFIRRLDALQNNPENLRILTQPLLQNPIILYLLLAVLSGMAPLVEELLKPLALWALVGRNMPPAQGFATGAICGGAFALFESLLNLANVTGEGWASLILARSGTATLHIATTALVGWGLASAWKNSTEKDPQAQENFHQYLRLGLSYLASVLLHGLWNGLSVLTLYNGILETESTLPSWVSSLAAAAPIGLVILAFLLLIVLVGGNRVLRQI